jgi:hypothetical protein
MSFTSSTELLDWLSQNLFLNPQQVEELRPWVAQEPNQHAFCKEMVRRNWLTLFQAQQILKNNAEKLVVGANRLHSRLGEGAMGQVYRAWNVRLGRMVAVKMLHSDRALGDKAMDRFRREMQTAAALDHPNIVLLRDADESNQVPYLVMDYFEGVDLACKLGKEGPQPIPQAAEYIRQAALGLQHAFERGIVHRDIKPSNMLLVKTSDGATIVKLLDFGLAKFEREEDGEPLTQAGRLIGTVDYMAPEQATDAHSADIRADIYSLGCTFFHLITGKTPFGGNNQLEKLTSRIMGDPPRLNEHLADAPAGLEDVLLTMLAREPADRYQEPREVVAALAPFCVDAASGAPVIQALPIKAKAAPLAQPVRRATGDNDAPTFQFGPASADAETVAELPPIAAPRQPTPPEAEPTPFFRRPPVMIGIGAAMLLSLSTIAYLIMRPTPTTVEAPLGTMTLSLDSPPNKVWARNDRKPIIVKVARHDFSGPVTLSVENLPAWMQASPVTVGAARNEGELTVLIRVHDQQGPFTMKIVGSAARSAPASIEYEMEIVPFHEPAGKAKDAGKAE